MAITRTALTTSSSKTSQSSVATASVSVNAGELLVIIMAYDDVVLNSAVWNGISMNITDIPNAVGAGVRVRMGYLIAPSTASSTITMTWASAITAKAWAVSKFTNVNTLLETASNTGTSGSPDTTSLGTDGHNNAVFIADIGTEGPSGDTVGTATNSFTLGQRSGTTGNPAAGNITVQELYRIVTSSTTTSAGKTGMTSRDWAAIAATFGLRGFPSGQAQAKIKTIGNGLGQSQATLKGTGRGVAQAQSDIKTTYNAFGQAQARLVRFVLSVAAANITTNINTLTESFTRTTSNGWGSNWQRITNWPGDDTYYATNGSEATITIPTQFARSSIYEKTFTPTRNGYVKFQVKIDDFSKSSVTEVAVFTPIIGTPFDSTNIGVYIAFDPSNGNTISVRKMINDSLGTEHADITGALNNTYYTVLFQYTFSSSPNANGTFGFQNARVRLKVWKSSDPEPDGWLVEGVGTTRGQSGYPSTVGDTDRHYVTGWDVGPLYIEANTSSALTPIITYDNLEAGPAGWTTVGQAQAKIIFKQTGLGQANAFISGTVVTDTFVDPFTRTVSNGIGTAPNGDTWVLNTGSATNANVTGSELTLVTDTVTDQVWDLSHTEIQLDQGIEFSGSLKIDTTPTFITRIDFGIWGSSDPISQFPLLGLSLSFGSSGGFSIRGLYHPVDQFSSTVLSGVNTNYVNFKIHLLKTSPTTGTSEAVRLKVWLASDPEPGWAFGSTGSLETRFDKLHFGHPRIHVYPDTGAPRTIRFDTLSIKPAWIAKSAQAQAKLNAFGQNVFGQTQASITGGSPPRVLTTVTHVCSAYCQLVSGTTTSGQHWNAFTGTPTIETSNVPPGATAAWKFTGAGSAVNLQQNLTSGLRFLVARIYFNWTTLPSGSGTFFRADISGNSAQLRVTSGGQVFVAHSNITANVGSPITANTWHYADIAFDFFNATGTSYASLDGGTVQTASSALSQADMTSFRVGSQSNVTGEVIIGRILVGVGSTDSIFSEFPYGTTDSTSFYTVQATSGTHNTPGQFTLSTGGNPSNGDSSGNLINELPADTTSYIEQSVSDTSAYVEHIFDTSGATKRPIVVDHILLSTSTTTSANSQDAKLYDGNNTADTILGRSTNTTDIASYHGVHIVDPSGNAWSLSALQSLRTRWGYSNDVSPAPRLSSVLLEVENDTTSAVATTKRGYGQAQADIKTIGQGYGQSQADIKAIGRGYGQSQTDIKAVGQGFGQTQSDIKAISQGYAQGQADIKAIGRAFSQAQSDIKAVGNGLAQAQSDIKITTYGLAQSQADIKQTYNQFAQVQANVKQTYKGYSQANADIKSTIIGAFGQAQADILKAGYGFAQTQSDIKQVYPAYAQSQADIKQTYSGFAQAQACVKGNAFGQSQADIKAVVWRFAQAQADIKAVGNGLGQAQSDIKAIGNGLGQSNADIKATISGFAQAQSDIKTSYVQSAQAQSDIKATGRGFSQSQADIKQSYAQFAQAKADIKATSSSFAQTQADIKTIYNQFAQTQADIKQIYIACAQTQADIKITTTGCANAQSDIKQTYQPYSQAQADIKQTYQSYAQANANIKSTIIGSVGQAQADILKAGYGSANAQADIKQTYTAFAQSQADIKQTSTGYGQAQAAIKGNAFGQTQADIKATYWGLGQSQADINTTYNQYAQAQARLATVYSQVAQVQADIKATSNGLGQSQADIKTTYNQYGQAQSNIKQTYLSFAQANALIVRTETGSGQTQADIKATYNGYAQVQADINATSNGYGQVQATIRGNAFGQSQGYVKVTDIVTFAQVQANIKAIGYGLSQAQGYIKTVGNNAFGQTQADILATSVAHGQTQADIKQVYYGLGQSQADIQQTYNQYAHTQADIKAIGYGLAQSQADIKAVSNGYGQAQVDIKSTYQAFGQAQGTVKATTIVCGQAQADINTSYQAFAQAQAKINAFHQNVYGQTQANIRFNGTVGVGQTQAKINAFGQIVCGQTQADIKQTYVQSGNAQADIKAVSNGYGQAQGEIKQSYQQYGQTQANIVQTYNGYGQSQTYIKIVGQNGYGQAQSDIKAVSRGYGQAQAYIGTKNTASGQAQGTVKATSTGTGQAQADIKQTFVKCAQTQALIRTTAQAYGQTAAWIKATGLGCGQVQAAIRVVVVGQAQADIQQTYTKCANAQAYIRTTVNSLAQTQALIVTTTTGYGQAQASIQNGNVGLGQANAWIKIENNVVSAQAEAVIEKTAGYAQALALITQPHILHGLDIAVRETLGLLIGIRRSGIDLQIGVRESGSLTIEPKEKISVEVGVRNTLSLGIGIREF